MSAGRTKTGGKGMAEPAAMTATPFLISEKFFSEKFFGEILGNIFLGKFWEIFWPNFENIFALLILAKNVGCSSPLIWSLGGKRQSPQSPHFQDEGIFGLQFPQAVRGVKLLCLSSRRQKPTDSKSPKPVDTRAGVPNQPKRSRYLSFLG